NKDAEELILPFYLKVLLIYHVFVRKPLKDNIYLNNNEPLKLRFFLIFSFIYFYKIFAYTFYKKSSD
ncbi:MAG TPA: hypothetical protein PLS00_15775, partial [Niabella sp.]|nr:hypothetical protein [Niabella sp.]